MIGGRILDVGAVRGLLWGTAYMHALHTVAVDRLIVLRVPMTALAEGIAAGSGRTDVHDVHDLLGSPVLTFADFDLHAAVFCGDLGMSGVGLSTAQVLYEAAQRPDWAVVTDRVGELQKIMPGLKTEPLP